MGGVVDQVLNLFLSRVLPEGAEDVAEGARGDGAVPALVVQGKGFLDVCERVLSESSARAVSNEEQETDLRRVRPGWRARVSLQVYRGTRVRTHHGGRVASSLSESTRLASRSADRDARSEAVQPLLLHSQLTRASLESFSRLQYSSATATATALNKNLRRPR